jgi:uncharacterized protein YecE (DUF72 family)
MVRIGTAGWVIPWQSAERAVGEGSHLERYARVMNCVEINSSFHRGYRPATWLEDEWDSKVCVGPSALWFFAASKPRPSA